MPYLDRTQPIGPYGGCPSAACAHEARLALVIDLLSLARYPPASPPAAELVDYPNRRRHSKRRAGTVKSSAGTVSAAPAGYASYSNHSGSACQELTGFSVFLLFFCLTAACTDVPISGRPSAAFGR